MNEMSLFFGQIILWVKSKYYNIKAFYQRGTKGYADRDLENLDYYLAFVIGNSISGLSNTFETVDRGFTEDEYRELLKNIALGFQAYVTLLDKSKYINPEELEMLRIATDFKLEESLVLFKKHFRGLWENYE